MNKESVLKSLKAACVSPMKHILDIILSRDSAQMKLRAIELYCRKTLEIINKTAEEKLK